MTNQPSQPTPSRTTPPTSNLSGLMTYAVVIVPLMCAWGIFLYIGIGSLLPFEKQAPVLSTSPAEITEDSVEQPQQQTELSNVDYGSIERSLIASMQKEELKRKLKVARQKAKSIEALVREFNTRISALKNSEDGRRLATPSLARRFEFLTRFPDSSGLRRAEQIFTRTENIATNASAPINGFGQHLTNLSHEIIKLELTSKRYREATDAIDELLSVNSTVKPNRLGDVISQLNQYDQSQIKFKGDEQIAEIMRRQQQSIAEHETRQRLLKQQLADAKAAYSRIQSTNQNSVRQSKMRSSKIAKTLAQKKKDKAAAMKSAYPALQQSLLPFTSNGNRQPDGSGRLRLSSENGPLSYSGLLSTGALDNTQKGLRTLFYLVQPNTALGKQNDRPLGNFPEYRNFSDFEQSHVQQKLKSVQVFLIKHGQAMVDEGLLSK